jgi:hypothetical protein
MALMLYLDDAMKVLLQNDFIKDGYIDDDGGSEVVRNELEQKCYLREPVDIVLCKDCKHYRKDTCSAGAGMAFPPPDDWYCADGEREPE